MGGCSSRKSAETHSPRESDQDGSTNGNAGKTGTIVDASNDAREGVNTSSNHLNSATTAQGDDSDPSASNRKLTTSSTRRRRLSVIPSSKGDGKSQDGGEDPTGKPADLDQVTNERGERMILTVDMDGHPMLQGFAGLSAAGMEPGYDKVNQDYICIQPLATADASSGTSYMFAVLDGHGAEGHHVSKTATSCLSAAVANGADTEDMAGHLWDTFCTVNNFLTNESGIDCTFSGATATVSVLIGGRLTSAWVGDSRAVLGRLEGGSVHAYDLTNDHKPDLPEETVRIESAGGRVEPLLDEMNQPIGPPRVWLSDSWMPGLAMSRSLGDTLAASCGVTCCPDVSVVDLTEEDVCIVWASDGVWEFMSSQDAIDVVAECGDPSEAAAILVRTAQKHWQTHEVSVSDDISCVVALLNVPTPATGSASAPAAANGTTEQPAPVAEA